MTNSPAFSEYIRQFPPERLRGLIDGATQRDVADALNAPRLTLANLAALLSPAAAGRLEDIAQRAAYLTRLRFGNMIVLFTPAYLSNQCVNTCKYCGFNKNMPIARRTLSPAEAIREYDAIRVLGFSHILLLTGEDRRATPIEYMEEMVKLAAERFHSVSLEVFPMTTSEYERMVAAGCDGLALYQETYDPDIYQAMHPSGPKRNYNRRLDSPSFGAAAGMRFVGLGYLMGLADWRIETLYLGLHARYIMRHWWRTKISLSFPRLRPCAAGFSPDHPVSDRDMVSAITALRLFLPDADMVLTTRESPALRDRLIPLGITRMSAGSRTDPGGYSGDGEAGRQFDISDERTPEHVAALIESKGFEPVWKDFDRAFMA